MFVKKINFQNFRNFKALDLALDPGFVVLEGLNGAGKTNFLEGVYYTACLKRFPESQQSQIPTVGSGFFRNQVEFQNQETSTLEVYYQLPQDNQPAQLKLKSNKAPTTRPKYTGQLVVISFLPQDLGLLTRSPATRRRYLDETLSAGSAEYRQASSQYNKVLRQRNELWQSIGRGESGLSEMDVWDQQLAEFGGEITRQRQLFVEYLNTRISPVLTQLSPDLSGTEFVYQNSAVADKSQFLAALQGLRRREQEMQVTLLGPHRDDFGTLWNGQGVAGFISRGQMRSIILALKILEKERLKESGISTPIMILDDVFSEFDRAHQKALVETLLSLDQVFLTTSHMDDVAGVLPARRWVYRITNGSAHVQ